MQLFQVETEDEVFVVIAESAEKAKQIIAQDYFDDDIPRMDVTAARELKKGIVLSYDYEDINWHN